MLYPSNGCIADGGPRVNDFIRDHVTRAADLAAEVVFHVILRLVVSADDGLLEIGHLLLDVRLDAGRDARDLLLDVSRAEALFDLVHRAGHVPARALDIAADHRGLVLAELVRRRHRLTCSFSHRLFS